MGSAHGTNGVRETPPVNSKTALYSGVFRVHWADPLFLRGGKPAFSWAVGP